MNETVELIDGVSGNFLTPVTEQFTKEPFNLDELINESNFFATAIQNTQVALTEIQEKKAGLDAKITLARAAGAKTTAEIAAETPIA